MTVLNVTGGHRNLINDADADGQRISLAEGCVSNDGYFIKAAVRLGSNRFQ